MAAIPILVTGGNRGIGLQICRELVSQVRRPLSHSQPPCFARFPSRISKNCIQWAPLGGIALFHSLENMAISFVAIPEYTTASIY